MAWPTCDTLDKTVPVRVRRMEPDLPAGPTARKAGNSPFRPGTYAWKVAQQVRRMTRAEQCREPVHGRP